MSKNIFEKTFDKSLDKKETKEKTDEILKQIGELQYQMYAEGKHSVMIILQGLDAAGKDGVARGLLRHCKPAGYSIASFNKPTELEYKYDFLWRVHQKVPAKGYLTIFNRSHYEDILVPSVEGYISKDIIEERYELINFFERLLIQNGTIIFKFFLNVSSDVQKERLDERLQIRRKNWKHHDSDWTTRLKAEQYLKVYENIFERCNEVAPWHIIPADTNWQKLYYAAKIVLERLEKLDMEWPELSSNIF